MLNGYGTNRHALIVCIAPGAAGRALEAQNAASSGIHTHYQVTPNDICDTARVFECSDFPNDHRAYNELLKRIVHDWMLHLTSVQATYGSAPEGRLFISAPTSLAFSLGGLLPVNPQTTVIDYI